jgi:molecular chaperone GrpE
LENTKRRMQRDIENAHKYAVEKFVIELLPVKDSLEMGLEAAKYQNGNIEKLLEGTELTLKMFNDAVNKFGVEVLDPIDQPFNPEFHQAMSMQESHIKPANTVLAVMQKGYTLNGRLVRPAMVVVSKASPQSGSSDDKSGSEKVGTNIDEQA